MLGDNEHEFPPHHADSTSDVALTEPQGLLVLIDLALRDRSVDLKPLKLWRLKSLGSDLVQVLHIITCVPLQFLIQWKWHGCSVALLLDDVELFKDT